MGLLVNDSLGKFFPVLSGRVDTRPCERLKTAGAVQVKTMFPCSQWSKTKHCGLSTDQATHARVPFLLTDSITNNAIQRKLGH